MSNAPVPSESEVTGFLSRLRTYRDTLSEGDQRLLDTMVASALGETKQEEKAEQDVAPFWVAYNPPGYGYANPPGYGYAAGGWNASPWGASYGVRYW